MVVRNIARARLRSALTVTGVALSASILLLGLYSVDAMDALMKFQYGAVERQDATVSFESERGLDALYEMQRLGGVRRAEPELAVPVRLVHGQRERRTGITGIAPDSELYGLVDRRRHPVPRPTDGLVLSSKLAELLGVRAGGRVEVHVLNGKKPVFTARVERTVDEYIGTSAYADFFRLSRWMDEEAAMTGVRLLVDGDRRRELSRELKELPAVQAVTFKDQSLKVFEDTLAASMGIMTTVLVVFAGVISLGVIYNASRISFAERERTLASMRVIGFSEREVTRTLAGENVLLSLLGVPVGLLLGWLFCYALSRMYDSDLYRFPFVVRTESVLLTAGGVLVFTLMANLAVRWKVARLDLVEALKSRE
jgi:putative ABC transport system permease protein